MYHLKIFAECFIALFAVMRLTGMETKNPLSIILFIILMYTFHALDSDTAQSRTAERDPLLCAILAVLFATFTAAANYETIFADLSNAFFCAAVLLFSWLGLFLIYFYLCLWLLGAAGRLPVIGNAYSSAWLSAICVVACMLCWLFYFLYEYPGVMTPDSINQYAQVIGEYELSNHHSIVHTALIGLFYNIGISLTGSASFGIALYTLAQMLFMALSAGYVVKTMQKAYVQMPIIIAAILFYALMPYNGIYAVTVWKDIPFAGCFTIFTASLVRFLLRGSASRNERLRLGEYFSLVLPYVLSGAMLCLLRANGWYAFLVSLPFILFAYRKSLRVMLPLNIAVLLLMLFVKYPVMEVYDVKQTDFVESLSVPVQQLARVIANGESVTDGQLEFLENIMDVARVGELYQPDVADNIKNLIRESGNDYLETHKGEFFKNWFLIGLSHPKAYLDAFIDQTVGFWYPDVSYEVGLADGIYDNDFGLTWQPIIRGRVVVKIREILFKLQELMPLYGLLWSMGLMTWALLIVLALCLRSDNGVNALCCLPLLLLTLTLFIATPVATEFRYAYPLFFAMPLLVTVPFVRESQ